MTPSPMFMMLALVYIVVCTGLMTVILLQKKRSAGLGASMSGMGSTPSTYWDKNKGRSMEGKLEKYTKILGAVFMILSLVLTMVR